MTTRVVTDKVRFSFCNVCSPRRNEFNGKDEFSTQILVAKSDTATVAALKAAAKAALATKWGDKVPAKVRNPLRDGDTETKGDGSALGPEYKDHFFMTVKSSKRPGIIDSSGVELLGSDDVASGDWGRVSLNAYAYDAAGNKGVSFGLNNVQLMNKGESLGGGRPSAAADFGVATSTAAAPVAETVADDDNW
jgi:hypothetical protein